MSGAEPVSRDQPAPVLSAGAGAPLAHAAMLLYALIISTSFPVGAALTSHVEPVVLTFLRFLLATAIFAALVTARRNWYRPSARQFAGYAWIGVLLASYFILMFEALRWTTTINTSAIFTLLPAMSAAIAFVLLGQRISRIQQACLALGALGAATVLFGEDLAKLSGFGLGYGEALFFTGCIAFAAYMPFVRKLHGTEPLIAFTFWVLAMGSVLLFAVALPMLAEIDWAGLPGKVYAGIVYLAVFPTAGTFYLGKYASLRLPSGPVMGYTYLVPGFVVAQELALGAPWPGAFVIAGAALALVATLVLQVAGRR